MAAKVIKLLVSQSFSQFVYLFACLFVYLFICFLFIVILSIFSFYYCCVTKLKNIGEEKRKEKKKKRKTEKKLTI